MPKLGSGVGGLCLGDAESTTGKPKSRTEWERVCVYMSTCMCVNWSSRCENQKKWKWGINEKGAKLCGADKLLFFFLINLFIYLFIYFWLCWVSVAALGLSVVAASRGYSSLWCAGFSLWWLLSLWSTGSRAQAQYLWHTGLVALRHVGSSRTRARTRVPCIGRWSLNHCTTREVPNF